MAWILEKFILHNSYSKGDMKKLKTLLREAEGQPSMDIRSNIDQFWQNTPDISKDLIKFAQNAYNNGGIGQLTDIAAQLRLASNTIKRIITDHNAKRETEPGESTEEQPI